MDAIYTVHAVTDTAARNTSVAYWDNRDQATW